MEELLSPEHQGAVKLVVKLMRLQRAKFQHNLEAEDDPVTRGKSQHCRDILKLVGEEV